MRYKLMKRDEMNEVADRKWVPVKLIGDAIPNWMRGILDEKLELVLISGSFIDPRIIKAHGNSFHDVVGGMDIYRYDENDVDKGYPYNKDHYIIVLDPVNDDALLVYGPFKDHEHWIPNLPDLRDDIIVLSTEGD